jgi:hypothetical protein
MSQYGTNVIIKYKRAYCSPKDKPFWSHSKLEGNPAEGLYSLAVWELPARKSAFETPIFTD